MMRSGEHGKELVRPAKPVYNRRQAPRRDIRLNLTFSGMHAAQIVMDTGTIFNLCRNGVGLHTTRSLRPGTVLALFIESPDSEEDICIPEARVEWVNATCHGLSIQTIRPEDRARLQRLFSKAPADFRNYP